MTPMKKRYLISAGVLAVCVCLTLAVLALFPARPMKPEVTRANIHRIEIGMTRAEVDAVLGPGGSPTGGPHLTLNGSKAFTWWGEHGTISLAFDDDGPGQPVLLHQDRLTTGGRGLQLVEALSARWGVDRHALGKTVWFRVP